MSLAPPPPPPGTPSQPQPQPPPPAPPSLPTHRGVAPEALLAGYLEAIPAHEDHAIDEARPPPHLAHLFATELGDADLTAEDVRSSSSSSNG